MCVSPSTKNILLLCYPHYGHIIPLLELAKKLAQYHNVTFVVSEAQVAEMKGRHLLHDDLPAKFRCHGLIDELTLSDCTAEGSITYMEKIFHHVSSAMSKLLDRTVDGALFNGDHLDYVVLDYFQFATALICHEKQIPFYFFDTASAGLTCAIMAITDDYKITDHTTRFFATPENGETAPVDATTKNLLLNIKKAAIRAEGVIYNSARDMEMNFVNKIEQEPLMNGQKLFFVGPLVSATDQSSQSTLKSPVEQWLDLQSHQSVIYVSFGSLVFPDHAQLMQIGLGLLASQKPFILSLPEHIHCYLPESLQRSTPRSSPDIQSEKFLLVSWANQKAIIGHPAVSVFVSHCGWNGTLEAIFAGVPVIGWPLCADQKINALWFKNHGAGEMFDGTGSPKPDRLVEAEEVSLMLRKVAKNVTIYQSVAVKWQEMLKTATGPNGSSRHDFDKLLAV